MLLRVEVEDAPWVADVGFGSWGLMEPVPLAEGESRQLDWVYRLARVGDLWALQAPHENGWQSLYEFSLEPQLPIDFEPVNYYTSTHPNSRFTQIAVVQSLSPTLRRMLRDRELLEVRHSSRSSRRIDSDEELLRVLAELFGLPFPPGTRFRPRNGNPGC
jgi:N-hydroxyarylamine O-acetyltransferase